MDRKTGPMTLALVLIALALAGCTSGGGTDDGLTVHMQNVVFSPETLHVGVGDTVTWVNDDPMGHTVTPEDPDQWGTAGSGDASADWMMQGDTWQHTFTAPGTYHYYCKPHASMGSNGMHQGMVGTIVVD